MNFRVVVVTLVMVLTVIAPAGAEAWVDLYGYSYGPNEYVMAEMGFIDLRPANFNGFCSKISCVDGGICDSYMGLNARARAYLVPTD